VKNERVRTPNMTSGRLNMRKNIAATSVSDAGGKPEQEESAGKLPDGSESAAQQTSRILQATRDELVLWRDPELGESGRQGS